MTPRGAGGFVVGLWLVCLLASGCGAGTNAGSGSPSTTESQSSGAGGASAHGGSASAGSSAGGTKASAGAAGTNNAGASAGCHDVSECPNAMTPPFGGGIPSCLAPGQAPPSGGCGAPMWCGQCNCPPMPVAPMGNGLPCQTSQDCPAPSEVATASVCFQGSCTRCGQNSDCPATAPICGTVSGQFLAGFRTCLQCATDQDCPGERPYCQVAYGTGGCVACRNGTDCAQGVCAGGVCTPGCGPDKPCAEPAPECKPELRCGPRSCTADSTCGRNMACVNGGCGRRACKSDSECDGKCVNGGCFDTLGSCYTQLMVP